MDPVKRDPEITAFAAELSGVAERQFASFLDEIARIVEESEMTYHEASWALRSAATYLRNRAVQHGESL